MGIQYLHQFGEYFICSTFVIIYKLHRKSLPVAEFALWSVFYFRHIAAFPWDKQDFFYVDQL